MKFKTTSTIFKFICLMSMHITTSFAQTDAENLPTDDPVDDVAEVENINQVEQEIIADPAPNRFDRQLIAELDSSLQRVLDALEEEDAFSLKLSELYSEYGAILSKVGRLDDAREVYSQALHIQKVNHGIYSTEQLYFLNKLFEIELQIESKEDGELIEQYLKRAISIENKNTDVPSDYLNQMLIRAGHYFLDEFYRQTRRVESQLLSLRTARHYFQQVLVRNSTSEKKLKPYGELFLVTYLETTIISDVPLLLDNSDRLLSNVDQRFRSQARNSFQSERNYTYLRHSYNRGYAVFNKYIREARKEGNTEGVISALLGWADTLTLFNRSKEASVYYKLAWTEVQSAESNQKLSNDFSKPKLIPAYEYLVDRQKQQFPEGQLSMPLILSVTKGGTVSNVKRAEISDEQTKQFRSIRRNTLKLNFRPAIIDGQPVDTNEFAYEARVRDK